MTTRGRKRPATKTQAQREHLRPAPNRQPREPRVARVVCRERRKPAAAMVAASAPDPLLLSVLHAGRALGLGRTRIYDLLNQGRLDAVKIGKRTLVTVDSLKRLAQPAAKFTPGPCPGQ
jgi:Helix-turn-helix domain